MVAARRDELWAQLVGEPDDQTICYGETEVASNGLTAGELRELLRAHEELELLRRGRATASDAREAAEHALRTSSVRLAEVAPFVCGFCAGDAFARRRGRLPATHEARTAAGTAAKEGE